MKPALSPQAPLAAPARLIVQIISLRWSKQSRGGPGATARNKVARALPLHDTTSEGWHLERWHYQEAADGSFSPAPVRAGQFTSLPARFDGLLLSHEVRQDQAILKAQLCWDKYFHGMPPRHTPSSTLRLTVGETAQICINGRHGLGNAHTYTRHCYNIAYGGQIAADVFVAQPFRHRLELEAQLF